MRFTVSAFSNVRTLDPGIAPERCYLGDVNTARDSRATLVGVAVWFIFFLVLIRRPNNVRAGASRPVDYAYFKTFRRDILSGEVAVADVPTRRHKKPSKGVQSMFKR